MWLNTPRRLRNTMSQQARVTICFDDGRWTGFFLGSKILEKYKVRGTFYPVTSFIGGEDQYGKFVTWNELKLIAQAGHEIGNHTHSHDENFATQDPEAREQDVATADKLLMEQEIVATTFCYPFGKYNPELRLHIGTMGFTAARTIDTGINMPSTNLLALKCFQVENTHTIKDVDTLLQEAIAMNSWLILCFHHLDDKTFISTPPALFENIVQHIIRQRVPIVTLSEGLVRKTA